MTDLQRARGPNRQPDDWIGMPRARFDEIVATARRQGAEEAILRAENADADAYRRGAAEMRERAAAATAFCCFECSRVIRALPLTPEERV